MTDRLDRMEAVLATVTDDLRALTTDLRILRGAQSLTDHHLDGLRSIVRDMAEGVRDLTEGVKVTDETARRMWEVQTRASEDISRLYAAWPEHLRSPRPNGHGGDPA